MADPALEQAKRLHMNGQVAEAHARYTRYLELRPNSTDARYLRAMAECQMGHFQSALQALALLTKEVPGNSDYRYLQARALAAIDRQDEAIPHLLQVLKKQPGHADAVIELVRSCLETGRDHIALDVLSKVGKRHRRDGRILYLQAVVEANCSNEAKALDLLIQAERRDPNLAEIPYLQGKVLGNTGDHVAAEKAFDRALAQDPNHTRARFGKATLLPLIYQDDEAVGHWRKRYESGIDSFIDATDLDDPGQIRQVFETIREIGNFNIGYQGRNDKALMQRWGRFVCEVVARRFPEFANAPEPPPRSERPIRVGFFSPFLHSHTISFHFEDWHRGFNDPDFEAYVYSLQPVDDARLGEVQGFTPNFRRLDRAFAENCRIIRADKLDLMIYLDIGMKAAATCYAALPLAPVQAVAWGHPVTTGLPTVQYFLSGEAVESSDADDHYSEEVARLPGVGARPFPLDAPAPRDRAPLGLSDDDFVCFCSQSLFKLLPQSDVLFASILKAATNAKLLCIAHSTETATQQYRQRLFARLSDYDLDPEDRVRILPRMSRQEFLATNAMADCYLDTPDWSGGRSLWEAVAMGLVPVVQPGRFARGRFAAGMLTVLGCEDMVVESAESYVAAVKRLADEPDERNAMSRRLLQAVAETRDRLDPQADLKNWIARALA